jgi:hypothetical protein
MAFPRPQVQRMGQQAYLFLVVVACYVFDLDATHAWIMNGGCVELHNTIKKQSYEDPTGTSRRGLQEKKRAFRGCRTAARPCT